LNTIAAGLLLFNLLRLHGGVVDLKIGNEEAKSRRGCVSCCGDSIPGELDTRRDIVHHRAVNKTHKGLRQWT
jgi:hypothetical protein